MNIAGKSLMMAAWACMAGMLMAGYASSSPPQQATPASKAAPPATAPAEAAPVITGAEKKNGYEVYTVTSGYQKGPCPLFVLLPDKFEKTKQYKVLYMLPCWIGGSPGLDEAKKLNLANQYGIICVYTGYSEHPSKWGPWYGDNPADPSIRCDSYLTEVIVPFIDKSYPTIPKPEGRLLVGFSKSGLGALSVFLRHPDVFGREASWDAPLLMGDEHQDYWGPPENWAKNYSISYLLNQRLDVLKDKAARIAIAGPGPKGGMTGSGAHDLMSKLGIPHYYNPSLGGAHAWTSGWLGPMVEVLMSEDMAKVQTAPTPAEPKK